MEGVRIHGRLSLPPCILISFLIAIKTFCTELYSGSFSAMTLFSLNFDTEENLRADDFRMFVLEPKCFL